MKATTLLRPLFVSAIAIITALFITSCATFSQYQSSPDIQHFMQEMVSKYHFSQAELDQLFSHFKVNRKVIALMTAPHEKKSSWTAYRAIFLTPARVRLGAQYWQQHAATLAYAQQRYGVPPEIIVAILGVETYYGSKQGGFKAFDALATLAFYYPPREAYFQSELAQYLLLTRDIPLDPLQVKGSYAGALGAAQFMPSSYRHYAVSYNNPGYSNLFSNPDDAIVSVANYFQQHGWQPGQSITTPARISYHHASYLPPTRLRAAYTLGELAHYGIYPKQGQWPPATHANLVTLTRRDGSEYWIGFHNFYVITQYNTSPMYAMAVYQLAQQIRAAHNQLG